MSLYDNASLVMIPSGYKDDKLYSIKPTDGSGDFTFSRDGAGASPATRVNASGLIEKGRTNELLQSNSFDTTWLNSGTTETGGQSDKDGGTDAWLITKTASFGQIYQSVTASGVFTQSVYAKAGTLNWIAIENSNISADSVYFDLANGLVGTTGANVIDAQIESVGSGWYRCSVAVNGTSGNMSIYPADGDGDLSGTSGTIYIQDAQLEQGLVATAPAIETTTAPVSAGLLGDMPRLDYSGGATCPSLLLEPSRVNSVIHSEYLQNALTTGQVDITFTPNYGISPEGVKNSTRIQFADNSAYAYSSVTITTNAVASMYVKGTSGERFRFGLASSAASGGLVHTFSGEWERISNTSSTATQLIISSYGGTALDFEAYGLQLEQDATYPTSYIPTYGSASTRGVDSCVNTSASSIIGQTEGTLFLDLNPLEFADSSRYLSIESASGAGSGWIGIFASSPDKFRIYGDGFDVNFSGYSVGDRAKIALTYKNGVATDIYINGVNKGSVTANTTGKDYSILKIGKAAIGGIGAGEFKQVLVFPTALTSSEALALTTI